MFSKTEKALKLRKLSTSNSVCSDDSVLSQSPRPSILVVPRLSPINICREPLTFVRPFGYVPTILVNASKIIESHITERELFQIQGSLEKVEYLNHVLSRKRLTKPRNTSVHDVAEVVKVYLSRMSPEIIPEEIMTRLITIHQGGTYADYFRVIHKFHRLLPRVCPSVHFVLHLLNKVAFHSNQNGMDTRKLATIFVLDILKPLSHTEDNEDFKKNRLRRVQRLPYNIMAVEYLIQNVNIFELALPMKESPSSRERNNNWEEPSKHIEVEEKPPIREEGSLMNADCRMTYSTTSRETRISNDSIPKDKMEKKSITDLQQTASHKYFAKSFSERGLSPSDKCKRSKDEHTFSSLNILKDQDNHNSVDKTDLKQIASQTSQQTLLTTKKRSSDFIFEEKRSPNKCNKEKDKASVQGSKEGAVQPSKTKESSQKSKQPSSTFRIRLRSHSDSAKDLAEFKLPRRFKLSKRGKSKEGKKTLTGSKLFKNDEELLPWGGVPTESEDVSLIVQSTQNPKTFQFLDKYHNTTGSQVADKVAVEPNVTPNPEIHRKYRWNKNKCSSARRKPSVNNVRTTARSASSGRRLQKKRFPPNYKVEPTPVENDPAFEFNKVFHSVSPERRVSSELEIEIEQPEQKDAFQVPIQHDPPPVKRKPIKPYVKKKMPTKAEAGTPALKNKTTKTSPCQRLRHEGQPTDADESPIHWGNVLEWLCDIVLIIIAAVCAIYIYHLLLI